MTHPEPATPGAVKSLTDTALRVIQVLDYIEEVQKMAEKTERTVSSDPFCAYEHEILTLPEISAGANAKSFLKARGLVTACVYGCAASGAGVRAGYRPR